MTGLLLGKSIQWTPLIQVLILSCGTLLSFIIAFSRGDVSLYLPFISETGAYSPEKCVFSLCLIIGSFMGIIIVFFRFIMILENPLNEDKKFFWLNNGALFIGIISMLGLAGVAAFPMTTVFWAHLVSAALYFLGSAVYFICVTITTYKVDGKSKICMFRFVLTVAIIILLFLLVICFPVSLIRWHERNDFIPALKKPENEGFTLILISSILEWAIVAIIIAYTLSFIIELRNHCLLITVAPESCKSDSIIEGAPTVPESSNTT